MGGTVVKKIKNSEYLYYSYYDDGKKLALYCGLASNPDSQRKAKLYEIEELEKQKARITVKIKELKNR